MEFICCFSNKLLPGTIRVDSGTSPLSILEELNSRPVNLLMPFTLELICPVDNANEKKIALCRVIERYLPVISEHIYKMTLAEITDFLSVIGRPESVSIEASVEEPPIRQNMALLHKPVELTLESVVVYWWDLDKCFSANQQIRHRLSTNHTVVGEYKNGRVEYFGSVHRSLRDFARYHYRNFLTYYIENNFLHGWYECECNIQGEWVYACTAYEPELLTELVDGQKIRHSLGEHSWLGTIDQQQILSQQKRYCTLRHFSMCHIYNQKAAIDSPQRLEVEINCEWYPILLV